MKKLIALLLTSLASLSVQADVPLDFEVSGQLVYGQVKAAGERFAPRLFHIRAEANINESLFSGIGLQGLVGVPVGDSTKNNLTVDVKSQNAVYVTLTDPDADKDALRFVVLLGYASTKLETRDLHNNASSDTFSGFSYGFSFRQRIFAGKPVYLSLDCTRFFRDSSLRIDGCGLGANYAF